ncbi:MAG TPA: SAM-dependent methyltransferase, partial [Umezawaea sp.]|nr:SAM-dependent methyltransferase [Umezawaea sp.]
GIPTVGNVHDIVAHRDPRCTVVYIDTDPVAIAHSQLLLQRSPNAAAVQADLRHVDAVLSHSTVRAHIDFDQPVAVLLCAVLHFLDEDDDPAGIVRRYVNRLTAGSYVAISHLTADDHPHDVAAAIALYRNGGIAVTARTKAEVTALFTGVHLVEPGVVHASHWRPEDPDNLDDPTHSLSYAGLAITTTDPS